MPTSALPSYSSRDCCDGEDARCVPPTDLSRRSKNDEHIGIEPVCGEPKSRPIMPRNRRQPLNSAHTLYPASTGCPMCVTVVHRTIDQILSTLLVPVVRAAAAPSSCRRSQRG